MKVLAPAVLLLAGSGFLFAKEAYRTFESLDRRDDLGLGVDFFVDEGLKAKKLTYTATKAGISASPTCMVASFAES